MSNLHKIRPPSIIRTALLLSALTFLGQSPPPATPPSTTTAPTLRPGPAGIIVAPDTTRLLGPQRPDGTVDYAKAIDLQFSQGVTPQNNAAVLFLKIKGTEFYGDARPPALKALGLDPTTQYVRCWHNWPGFHPGKRDSEQETKRFHELQTTPWSPADCPEVDAWLKSQDQALRLAIEACARDHFWFPILIRTKYPTLSGRFPSDIPDRIDQLLLLQASERIATDDVPGAVADLQAAHKLAWLLGQAPGQREVAWAVNIQNAACRGYLNLLARKSLDPQTLQKISTELQDHGKLPGFAEAVNQLDRYEYADDVQWLSKTDTARWARRFHLASGPDLDARIAAALKKENLPRLDFNRMLRTGNAFYDEFLEPIDDLTPQERTDHEIKLNQLEGIPTTARNKRYEYAQQHRTEPVDTWSDPQPGETVDAYSDRIAYAMLGAYVDDGRLLRPPVFEYTNCLHQATCVAVALSLYRCQTGHFPQALNVLVPDHLKKMPRSTSPRRIKYELTETGCTFAWTTIHSGPSSGSSSDDIAFELKK